MLIIKIIIVEYLLRQPLTPPTLRAEGNGVSTIFLDGNGYHTAQCKVYLH